MANPNKRSRRRERRRKVARRVAGRVLSHEGVQQVVSKGAGAVASIYGTPAAGLVVSRGLERAMEAGAGALTGPGAKRAKKAIKKSAKKTRKAAAKSARVIGTIGPAPASFVSTSPTYVAALEAKQARDLATVAAGRGQVVEAITEDLGITGDGELVDFPSAPEETRPFWQNPIYLVGVAAAAFFLLRKKK